MNCECITIIEKDAKEIYPDFEITGKALTFSEMKCVLFIQAEYHKPGKKKKEQLPIFVTYCPFCGIKLKKEGEG